MVDATGVVIEGVQKRRLELYFHRVVRLGALLFDVDNPPEPSLANPLDVEEVIGAHLFFYIAAASVGATKTCFGGANGEPLGVDEGCTCCYDTAVAVHFALCVF